MTTLPEQQFDPAPTAIGPGGDPAQPELTPPRPVSGDGADPRDREHPVSAAAVAARLDDATVEALGTMSEAVEWIERARGHLYEFHQLTGHADELLGRAADELERAGHTVWAAEIRTELVGRNVIEGRWTFQVVDEYDDTYWEPVRDTRRRLEAVLAEGHRHVHEAALKERRRSHGRVHHEATPPSA